MATANHVRPQTAAEAPPRRSKLVTAVAWFGIVTGACATPVTLAQAFMLGSLSEQLKVALDSQELAQLPGPVRLLFANFALLIQAFLVGALATLVASIGLLKRRNWGRLGVIVLLVVAILQQVGLFWIQLSLGGSADLPGETPPEMKAALALLKVVGGVLTVAQLGVCGWLIWKLGTPAIRAEFGP